MKTYDEYKDIKRKQDIIVDQLSDKLNSFPKGEFGMVIESIRLSNEYKAIKNQFAKEFKCLQEINKLGQKLFKLEIRKEHEEKRKQRYIK